MKLYLFLFIFSVFTFSCAPVNQPITISDPQKESSSKIINKNYEDVYEATKKALYHLGWQKEYKSKKEGIIIARTPKNLLTWGNQIQIKFIKINNLSTRIELSAISDKQIISFDLLPGHIKDFYKTFDSIIK